MFGLGLMIGTAFGYWAGRKLLTNNIISNIEAAFDEQAADMATAPQPYQWQ